MNGPGTTPVPGVGDQAQWSAPVPGATTPWVEAHKGSLTCVLSPADPDQTTIPYTGNAADRDDRARRLRRVRGQGRRALPGHLQRELAWPARPPADPPSTRG